LINVLLSRNKLAEAESEIDKIIPAERKNYRFYQLLSEFNLKSGKKIKAIENLNTALTFSSTEKENKLLRQKIDSLKKMPDK
jgi:predicted Zn-dependent protease